MACKDRKGSYQNNAVMERAHLNLKRARVGQKGHVNHAESSVGVADYVVNFYNAVDCIQRWAMCHPLPWNIYRPLKNRPKCPQKSDHPRAPVQVRGSPCALTVMVRPGGDAI